MKKSNILLHMILDKQLQKILLSEKLSLSELSQKTGIATQTLHNWINGAKPKNIDQLKKVANFFNISIDELCFGRELENTSSPIQNHQDEINAGVFEVVLRRVKNNE